MRAELLKKTSQSSASKLPSFTKQPEIHTQVIKTSLNLGDKKSFKKNKLNKKEKLGKGQNPGVSDRNEKDLEQTKLDRPDLEASWIALQRKTLLYEQLEREGGLNVESEQSGEMFPLGFFLSYNTLLTLV